MKKLLFLLFLLPFMVKAQTVVTLSTADTSKIVRTTGTTNAELILRNSTRGVANGILYNAGNGWMKYAIVGNGITGGSTIKADTAILATKNYVNNFASKSFFSATSPIFYNASTGVISSQAASGSLAGYVTTGTQTIAGDKTLTGQLTNTTFIAKFQNFILTSVTNGIVGDSVLTKNPITNQTGRFLATSSNSFPSIVERDNSGNFAAGTITASLTGHASLDAPIASPTFTGTVTIPSGSILNTPASMVGTNISGTAASLNIGGTAPAGTLTGTALASNVVTSSITTAALASLTATNTSLTFSGAFNGNTARTVGVNLNNAFNWTASHIWTGSDVEITGVDTDSKVTIVNNFSGGAAGIAIKNTSGSNVILMNGNTGAITTSTLGIGGVADNVNSQTYVPTYTAGTNVASVSNLKAYSYQIGSRVFVWVRCSVTPTLAVGTGSDFVLTLPVASNFTTVHELTGSGSQATGTGVGFGGVEVIAEPTGDKAQVNFNSLTTTGTATSFSFSYIVQ